MSHVSRVVVLMGPTGAGKSALALELAKEFDGEIISADSRQIYAGMDIGTDKATLRGRPKPQRRTSRDSSASPQNDIVRSRLELILVEGVLHHLIDILAPDQRYSAAEFRDDAQRIMTDILRRGKLPIVVGGTGFYIRVLTGHRSLPNVPPDPVFRAWADTQPVENLAHELQECAPDLAAKVDNLKNRQRVTRYLEVARGRRQAAYGRRQNRTPVSSLLSPAQSFFKLALLPPADTLREGLAARVEDQFRHGFVEEVRMLVQQYGASAPGLQAVGYRQVLPYLRNELTLEETQQAVLRAHQDYARRQLTWLKKEPYLVRATSPEEARRVVTKFLHRKDSR